MTTSTQPLHVNQRLKTLSLDRAFIIAIVALLGLRLVGLLNLPLFVDETLHITWTKQLLAGGGVQDAMNVGKVLSIWLWAPFVALPIDALLSSRLTGIVAAAISAAALISAGGTLHSRRAGLLAALAYLLLPYSFFYSRIALTDNFVTAAFAIFLWISVSVSQTVIRFPHVALLSLSGVVLVLSKLTGMLALPIAWLAALLFSPSRLRWSNSNHVFIALGIVVAVFLGFMLQGFGLVEFAFRQPGPPLQNVTSNVALVANFYTVLLTPPGALLAITALADALRYPSRVGLWLVFAFLLMVTPYFPVANTLYARYLLPSLVPLSLFMGIMLTQWLNRRLKVWYKVLIGVGIVWMLVTQIIMIVDLPSSPLPPQEMLHYIEGWSSGYGLRELIDEVTTLSETAPIALSLPTEWDTTSVAFQLFAGHSGSLTYCYRDQDNCQDTGDAQRASEKG